MKFYTNSHKFYCGADLHTKTIYLCVLDQDGNILTHRNISAKPEPFLNAIAPYRSDLVVGVECMFSWYWRETHRLVLLSVAHPLQCTIWVFSGWTVNPHAENRVSSSTLIS